MEIVIINQKITKKELKEIAQNNHGDMVKGVVDLSKNNMALGGDMHADAEEVMLNNGSKQEDLWGFNIFPDSPEDKRYEYISFINIRPRQNNFDMTIQDPTLRKKMKTVIEGLIDYHE